MELLERQNVQILEGAADWRDAIRKSVLPMEESGCVKPEYKEAIISGVESLGPYIVLAPSVALPHARPEEGVIKSQIAITLFKNDVKFEKKDSSARLFVALAAADPESHLNALMKISEILQDQEKLETILHAEAAEEIYDVFS